MRTLALSLLIFLSVIHLKGSFFDHFICLLFFWMLPSSLNFIFLVILSLLFEDDISVYNRYISICNFCFVLLLLLLSRKGDYYRYLAEFKSGDDRKEAADQSLKAYEVS